MLIDDFTYKLFTIVINLFGLLNSGKLRGLNNVDFHSIDEESVEQFAEIAVIHISKIVRNICKCYQRLDTQFTIAKILGGSLNSAKMRGLNNINYHSVDEESVEQFTEIAVIHISKIVYNFCHCCRRTDKQFTFAINFLGSLNSGKLCGLCK
jgi:hypothetical protein